MWLVMDIELEMLISIHFIRHEVNRVSFELSGQKVGVVIVNSTRHIIGVRAAPSQTLELSSRPRGTTTLAGMATD